MTDQGRKSRRYLPDAPPLTTCGAKPKNLGEDFDRIRENHRRYYHAHKAKAAKKPARPVELSDEELDRKAASWLEAK